MVAIKQLSLAALVWLGLASQGLALQVDEASNDLKLVERAKLPAGKMGVALAPNQKIPKAGKAHASGKVGVALAPNQKIHKAGKSSVAHASTKKAPQAGKLSVALAPNQKISKTQHKERDLEIEERDLEERKISAKGVAKGIGKVAKGALKLLLRDIEERDIDELDERDFEELVTRYFDENELTTRYLEEAELEERDLEERKVTAKGVAKGIGKVAKGALKLFLREYEELEERDFEELDERDFEELDERDFEELEERDFEELEERDLEERKVTAKGVAKGIGKVAKGAFKLFFRDIDELDERDLEELDERDFEELAARYFDESELEERDLEERKISAKGVAKGIGKVAKGALKLFLRDQIDERDIDELDERQFEELAARYFNEAELVERDFEELDERDLEERKISAKGVAKGIGKVAKGALKLLFRDISERDVEELDERDIEELAERHFDERELVARFFDESELEVRDLEERKISAKGVAKGIGKVAKGALKLLFRDIEERDVDELDERDLEELDERDLEEVFARYFDESELGLETRMAPSFGPAAHRASRFGGRHTRDVVTRMFRPGGFHSAMRRPRSLDKRNRVAGSRGGHMAVAQGGAFHGRHQAQGGRRSRS